MHLRCATCVLFIVSVFAEPYGRGGGRSGGSRGGGGYGSSSHSYPSSTGYSGHTVNKGHSYPTSTGLSGSGQSRQTYQHTQQHQTTYQHTQQHQTTYQHNQPHQTIYQNHQQHQNTYQHNQYHQTNTHSYSKTEVHHHYHYSPPQRIVYGTTYHPVYLSPPPMYVYEYRDSGSRFDTLLTGLALYNLGRMSERRSHYDVNRPYQSNPGEICKLGIRKADGYYEETRIDCTLMTSFIMDSGSQTQSSNKQVISTNKSTTTETRVDGSVTSVTVTESKTVVDALQVKGPSLQVTPDMQCFMIHISRYTSINKQNVDCSLLQMYAQQSLYRSNSVQVFPTFVSLLPLIFFIRL